MFGVFMFEGHMCMGGETQRTSEYLGSLHTSMPFDIERSNLAL